jgi:uncharacterized membrane protein YgcG
MLTHILLQIVVDVMVVIEDMTAVQNDGVVHKSRSWGQTGAISATVGGGGGDGGGGGGASSSCG